MPDHHLSSWYEQARGVIGREPDPGERYIFEFDDVQWRSVHMVGVRSPLEVTFLADGERTLQVELRPWTGVARAPADRIVEQPPP